MELLCYFEEGLCLQICEGVFVFESQVNVLVDELESLVDLCHEPLRFKDDRLLQRGWLRVQYDDSLLAFEDARLDPVEQSPGGFRLLLQTHLLFHNL